MTGYVAYMLSLMFANLALLIYFEGRLTVFELVAGFSLGVALCAMMKR
jgi:hypothetical protein